MNFQVDLYPYSSREEAANDFGFSTPKIKRFNKKTVSLLTILQKCAIMEG